MRIRKGSLRDFKTGAGFAGAKLSAILPAARVARYVRMTDTSLALLAYVRMTDPPLALLASSG